MMGMRERKNRVRYNDYPFNNMQWKLPFICIVFDRSAILDKKNCLIVFYLSQFITTMELHHSLCQEVWRHLSEVQGITTSPQL